MEAPGVIRVLGRIREEKVEGGFEGLGGCFNHYEAH